MTLPSHGLVRTFIQIVPRSTHTSVLHPRAQQLQNWGFLYQETRHFGRAVIVFQYLLMDLLSTRVVMPFEPADTITSTESCGSKLQAFIASPVQKFVCPSVNIFPSFVAKPAAWNQCCTCCPTSHGRSLFPVLLHPNIPCTSTCFYFHTAASQLWSNFAWWLLHTFNCSKCFVKKSSQISSSHLSTVAFRVLNKYKNKIKNKNNEEKCGHPRYSY